jgi:hypothetical protein
MDVHDLNKEILRADLTIDDFGLIYDTLKVKQRRVANKQVQILEVGDRVRFTNIKPKYMIGEQGTVTGFASTRVVVKLDRPVGKFSGNDLRVPATCVVRLNGDEDA